MNDKSIWKLSDEDFAVIEKLFEKKMALENLAKVVQADNEALYEKLLKDYAHVSADYDAWWANQRSGKRWTLLPIPPLRTVRESFPSYGSSLSKGPLIGNPAQK